MNLPDGSADYLAPYIVDDTPALVPIDFGEVCVNVDTVWLADHGLEVPTTFEDLTDPAYKDLFVAINPTTSSTGLAFLLATIGHFGEDGFAQYWQDLVANGTKIDEGWSDATTPTSPPAVGMVPTRSSSPTPPRPPPPSPTTAPPPPPPPCRVPPLARSSTRACWLGPPTPTALLPSWPGCFRARCRTPSRTSCTCTRSTPTRPV
ncbi:ABC transporter substrate-binding protein [Actinomyces ruminis]|uniref:ABC transporter substrate-binding protein n=1 Tax=Actinomyces ruminis TaxID=1937003 RepID=UPI00211EF1D0|nr:ABC transporter substrate-binding protein [Actinomyces ruminis]